MAMFKSIVITALLIATPAVAGDYAILDCKGIKTRVVMSYVENGVFAEWKRDPKDGLFRGGKELPRRLFRVEDGGGRVYYRGKLCIELEE
jgi:hypothetical protein